MLGILARGTDYVAARPKGHPIQPEPCQIIAKAEEILEKSWKQHAKEDMLHAKYDEGATVASYNEETREATLAALGCQVIEGQWK